MLYNLISTLPSVEQKRGAFDYRQNDKLCKPEIQSSIPACG